MWKAIEDAPMEVLVSEMRMSYQQRCERPLIDILGLYNGKIIVIARSEEKRIAQWWCELDPVPVRTTMQIIYDESGFSSFSFGAGVIK